MSKYSEFFDFVEDLIGNSGSPEFLDTLNEIREFYEQTKATDKPPFTETGLAILEFMQNADSKNLKAKDIADGILLSSRKVSGAMRKLVNDGMVDKFGANPVIYSITEQGKNININEYKENLKHEENEE